MKSSNDKTKSKHINTKLKYSLGRQLVKRYCKMCFESFTGRWAVLQLPCCPSKQGELSKNILQNLFNRLPPQTVFSNPKSRLHLISGDQLWCRGPFTIATTAIPPPSPSVPPPPPNGHQKAFRGHDPDDGGANLLLRWLQRRTTDHARPGP